MQLLHFISFSFHFICQQTSNIQIAYIHKNSKYIEQHNEKGGIFNNEKYILKLQLNIVFIFIYFIILFVFKKMYKNDRASGLGK